MKVNHNLSLTLFFSLLVHLLFLNNFNNILLNNTQSINTKPIKVEQITQKELLKYRRVGVRNGKRAKQFTMKTPQAKISQNLQKPLGDQKNGKKLDLRKLSLGNQGPGKISKEKVFRRNRQLSPAKNTVTYRKSREVKMIEQQQQIQQRMYNNLPPGSEVKQLMGKSGLNFKFEPVEGVSEDELNSAEKTFYSFQKRTFEKYYYSFIKTFNSFALEKPLIRKALMEGGHLLTGQIRFDREGNIISIRILNSSTDDDIHDLFEQTLKSIGQMPNPPDAFIKNKEEFSIYYQLQIKR